MNRLSHMIIFTGEMSRMRQFYEEQLGLAVRRAESGWVEYDTGGASLSLHAMDDPGRRGVQLRFATDDLETWVRALMVRGITVEGGIESYRWGKLAVVWDSEGNNITLLEPSATPPAGTGLRLRTAILNCRDFVNAVAFYRDKLALPVATNEPHWVEFDTGEARLALHARAAGNDHPLHADQAVACAFEVPDIDAFADGLRRRGAHFAAAPAEEEFGVYAEITDPDGYIVVFREPLPPRALEEELAEAFEDDGVPHAIAIRRPLKEVKGTSMLSVRPEYRGRKSAGRGGASARSGDGAAPARRRSASAGVAAAEEKPRHVGPAEREGVRPGAGRLRKAERRMAEVKKQSEATAGKTRPIKRAASRTAKPRAARAATKRARKG